MQSQIMSAGSISFAVLSYSAFSQRSCPRLSFKKFSSHFSLSKLKYEIMYSWSLGESHLNIAFYLPVCGQMQKHGFKMKPCHR